MADIIQQAEESVEKVLRFYEQQGTLLGYRPKIQSVNGVYPHQPDVLVMIKEEEEIAGKGIAKK